jgi:type III restriction enzyme
VKIDFIKAYFEALEEQYIDQEKKISVKERINKIQLAVLIKNE